MISKVIPHGSYNIIANRNEDSIITNNYKFSMNGTIYSNIDRTIR